MKKSLGITLCLSALFALISCGTKTANSDSQNTSNPDNSSDLEDSSSIFDDSSNASTSESSSSSSSFSSNSSSQSSSSSSSSNASSSSSSSSSSSNQDVYYTVTFLNYNDVLLQEVSVKEGEDAHYSGQTPTREEDDEFTYEFEGWDKDLGNITSNLTTKATYKYVSKENWGPIHWF